MRSPGSHLRVVGFLSGGGPLLLIGSPPPVARSPAYRTNGPSPPASSLRPRAANHSRPSVNSRNALTTEDSRAPDGDTSMKSRVGGSAGSLSPASIANREMCVGPEMHHGLPIRTATAAILPPAQPDRSATCLHGRSTLSAESPSEKPASSTTAGAHSSHWSGRVTPGFIRQPTAGLKVSTLPPSRRSGREWSKPSGRSIAPRSSRGLPPAPGPALRRDSELPRRVGMRPLSGVGAWPTAQRTLRRVFTFHGDAGPQFDRAG